MKLRMTFLAALTLMAATAQAQPVWNFGEVLQAAMVNHPLVLGKRSAQVAAQAERDGAEWQRYPSLTAQADTQRSQAAFFGTTPGFWLGLQADYDTEEAESSLHDALLGIHRFDASESVHATHACR